MRNILAIARKELQAYFASPIAYVVIGFFALLFGYFFYTLLWYFERQSMQVAMGSGQTMNINQMMIGPVFMNVSVIVLFVMPMITMRTYSEEKRSGTIELLLTSPLTDLQIILGKFFGALALYAVMLAVTFIHIGVLFFYGNPEWKPVATGYLGLLLMGGCFISAGLLISSLTKNQIVAGMVTFAVFLMLWVINWIGQSLGPTGQAVRQPPVDHRSPRRLRARDHRHQAPGLLRELHRVRALPHGQVRGQRTVAGLMATKISAVMGWLGTALVVVALALRFLQAGVGSVPAATRPGPAWSASWSTWSAQWRESQQGHSARQASSARCRWSASLAVLALLAGLNYLGVRQNKRWDLTANQVFSLSEQTAEGAAGPRLAGQDHASSIRRRSFDRFRDRLEEYTYQSKQLSVDYVDIDRQPARAKAANVQTAGTMVLEYKGRVERITNLEEQDIANALDQGDDRPGAQGLLHRRATARRTRPAASAPATARWPRR